jgi:hypothetical protein
MRYIPFGFMKQSIIPVGPTDVKYTYVATSGARVKQMSNYSFLYNGTYGISAFLIGGCTPVLPVLCFSGSKTSFTQMALDNSLIGISNSVLIQRDLKMDGSPTGTLTSCKAEIFVNSVLITSQTNSISQTIPVTGSGTLVQTFTLSGFTVNYGDFLEIRWTDNILS